MTSLRHGLKTFNGLLSSLRLRMGNKMAVLPPVVPSLGPAPGQRGSESDAGLRVLVVDDQPENRLLLEAMLSLSGIRPVHATNGAEALALASAQIFDIIFMDMQMPVMDGLTATAQIRDFERRTGHRRACIVVHSSLVIEDDWPILRACGFDAFLDKPCSHRSLEKCLQQRGSEIASRPAPT